MSKPKLIYSISIMLAVIGLAIIGVGFEAYHEGDVSLLRWLGQPAALIVLAVAMSVNTRRGHWKNEDWNA
jgi:putative effector of murein hydrolase